MTVMGLIIAGCFFFISRALPLPTLAKQKPHSTIFTVYMFFSLIGQFAIHLASLVFILNEAKGLNKVALDAEAEFKPNILNSALFLLSSSMQIATFAGNYEGHPFMQSLTENKPLFLSIISGTVFTFLAASGLLPFMDEFIQLVSFPSFFRSKLLLVMAVDFVASILWEKLSKALFK